VFTPRHPRAGKGAGKNPGKYSTLRRVGAAVGALALGTSLLAIAPLSASADTGVSTYGQGNFLSGTIGGVNLDKILAVKSATAQNDGSTTSVTATNPLGVSVLNNLLNVGTDAPVNIDVNKALGITADSGVLNQMAKANDDGTAVAGSGAVGSNGAITTGDPSGSGSVAVDLNGLLGTDFASVVGNLQLQLNAISASATGNADAVSGSYALDGADLVFTSPALANILSGVNSAIAPVVSSLNTTQAQLNNIGLSNLNINGGSLANVSGHALLSVSGAQLQSQIDSIVSGSYGSNGVSVNLATGAVTVDLAALQGGSFNNKPVDYELLSGPAIKQITDGITASVTSVVSDVVNKLTSTLSGVSVDVALHADVLGLSVLNNVTAPLTNGLGGLLGKLGLGALAPKSTPGSTPALATVDATVKGPLNAILNGTGTATAALTVAGIPLNIDASPLLGAVTGALGGVGNTGSQVTTAQNALDTNLIDPVTALIGSNDGSTNLDTLLTQILSIRLNHQNTVIGSGGGMDLPSNTLFTQTAVQIRVLPSAGATPLATVDLANATVGPNQTGTGACTTNCGTNPPGCTTNCGTNPPGCTTNCGPGTSGNPSSPTASSSSLAFTGVGIATIIAVILALLAAGAYLAREGYRRKHLTQL
jgi:hypothetical protein